MKSDPSDGPTYLIATMTTSTSVQTPSPPKLNSFPMPSCQWPR